MQTKEPLHETNIHPRKNQNNQQPIFVMMRRHKQSHRNQPL